MALVDGLVAALPDTERLDPRALTRAVAPGRVRAVALELLDRVWQSPLRADALLRDTLRAARFLHSRERRLVGDGLYATIRHHRWLDARLGVAAPPARWFGWLVTRGLAPEDAAAAWEGVPPAFAALADPRDGAAEALAALPPDEAVALAGSIDVAFARALLRAWGDDTGALIAAGNRRAPLVLRVNRRRTDRDTLAAELTAGGVVVRPGAWSADALVADGGFDVHASPAWRRGAFEVQDEGSQLVGDLVAGVPRVLDFCAGAGGKALQAAAAGAEVHVHDVRRRALDATFERARRAGVALRPFAGGRFDAVLVDAPCTGSGTLRRHPELRFRIDAADLARTTALQRRVLAEAAEHVAAGGRLVYATCSVVAEENDDVVAAFLAEHPDFAAVPVRDLLGDRAEALGDGEHLRVAPHTHGTDGFFAAVLRRR